MSARSRLHAACWGILCAAAWSAQPSAPGPAPFETLYRQAYETRLRELGPDHPKTVASLVRLGALLRTHGRPEEAEPLLRKALAAPGTEESGGADTLAELGVTLAALGRDEEAETHYLLSLEHAESGARAGLTLVSVASLREARGDFSGARRAYRDALKSFEAGTILTDNEMESRAAALNNLGLLLEAEGRLEEAESLFRNSADAYAEALGDPHPATAAARANLAGMLATRGKGEAAAALLEESVAVMRAAYGPAHDDTARLRNHLGEIYEALGRFDDAEAAYQAALSAWTQPSPSRGLALANLGRLRGVRGDLAAAERALAEAVRALEAGLPGHALELAEALDSYGSVLRATGRLDEAERIIRDALAIRERELGPSHFDVALSLVGLAGVLHLGGDLAQAEPLYRRALSIQERALGPNHPEVGETLYNLAHLNRALGDDAAAKEAFTRAESILSEAYGPDDPFVVRIRAELRAVP